MPDDLISLRRGRRRGIGIGLGSSFSPPRDPLAPPADLVPYWPEAEQIEASKTEYEHAQERPLWAKLLNVPSVLLGGEALRGAIRGGAEDGIGGALVGAFRGSPIAGAIDIIGDLLGDDPNVFRETQFSDIRKAFGQTNTDEGAGNFAINLLGDVLLDPVTFISPLGFLTKAENAATVAAKAMTLQKQVVEGIRGGLVFRVPILMDTGLDILPAIAKLPLPYFDKFKSLNVQYAKGMDQLYGIMRTSPVLGPILQKFGAIPIRDPEQAAKLRQAWILSREHADQFVNATLDNYHRLPESLKRAVAGDKDIAEAVTDLMESGVLKVDNEGLLTDYMRRLPQVMRAQGFRNQYQKDEAFKKLWQTAARGDPEDAIQATRTLHKKYDYYLPKKWLDEAGLPPRMGIDVEAPDTLSGGLGQALAGAGIRTPMEVERATGTALARGAGETGQAAFRARQEAARVERFKKLWGQVETGEIDKGGLEELLAVHKGSMDEVWKAERVSGAINGLTVPYFPRLMAPGVKRLIDKQQLAGLKRLKFQTGYSFQKERLLTDMSTTEANAFLMEIGSKVTGFEGLNVTVQEFKRELAEHGHWAVLKYIYPDAFIRKLNRVDEDMGSFFRSSPIEADFWRIKYAGQVIQKQKFFEMAFAEGSPLILDSARFADPKAVMSLVQASIGKNWSLNLIKEGGGLPKPQDAGDLITAQVGKDLRARISIHEHAITRELNDALADTTTLFDDRLEQYVALNKLGNKSDLTWSQTTPYSEMALKRAVSAKLSDVADLKAMRASLAAEKGVRREVARALQKDIDDLIALGESEKERLAMLAEGPIDLKYIDEFNARASGHVEKIMEASRALAAAKVGKRGANKEVVTALHERVVAKAASLQHAYAQEFSVRASIKHTIENMRTAQREVIAQKVASVGGKKEQLLEAMAQLKGRGLSAELVSNETKLWYRFSRDGIIGWDEFTPEVQTRMMKAGGNGRLVAMHPDTLEASKRLYANFTTPDTLRGNPFIRTLDSMRSWFVGMTVMHPAMVKTRAADMMGGMITAAQGGYFNPNRMALAESMSRAIGTAAKQGVTPRQILGGKTITREIDGATMDMADFLQEGQKAGLLGADLIQDSLLDVITDSAALAGKDKGTKIMDWALGFFGLSRPAGQGGLTKGLFAPQTNPVLRTGRKFARWGDDTVRIQTAISAWDQGMTVQDAIRTAVHWTYGTGKDITSFERFYARRLIPFGGFISWATRRSAELWMHKPGTLAWLGHLRDNAYNSLGLESSDMSRVMPKFINDGIGIPVANTPEGPKMYLFGSLFPLGSAFDLVNAVANMLPGASGIQPLESLRYIGQNMHPALKSMAELVINRDFFQGREIELFPGDHAELLGVEMPKPYRHVLKGWFRGLAELDRLNVFNAKEMKIAVDAVRRGDVLGRRKELPLIERFMSSAFGPVPPKGYQMDVEEELRYTRRRDEEELSRAKSLLRKAVSEGKKADVEALQKVISSELADIKARQAVAERYDINEQASKKVRLVR